MSELTERQPLGTLDTSRDADQSTGLDSRPQGCDLPATLPLTGRILPDERGMRVYGRSQHGQLNYVQLFVSKQTTSRPAALLVVVDNDDDEG